MAIGDPKTQSKMDKEIAALRKQHRAGNLTDFKLRHGIKKIKEKYGKAEPSTVTKVMTFLKKTPAEAGLFTPSPRSAKARAKAKETSKTTTVSDAQKRGQVRSGPSRKTTVSDAQKRGQLGKKKAPLLPKSPPKRPSKTTKKSEKMYNQINTQTGKVDFNKPKVTAAKRLRQEDEYKTFKTLKKSAKQSLKKKGK